MLHTSKETNAGYTKLNYDIKDEDFPVLTRNQRMVFTKLVELGRSAGAYELLDLLRPEGVNAIPTIYRALNELEEKGMVRHLASTKSFVALSNRVNKEEPKVMLVCEQCRSVTAVDDAGTVRALTENARKAGFTVNSRHLELVGICSKCNSK